MPAPLNNVDELHWGITLFCCGNTQYQRCKSLRVGTLFRAANWVIRHKTFAVGRACKSAAACFGKLSQIQCERIYRKREEKKSLGIVAGGKVGVHFSPAEIFILYLLKTRNCSGITSCNTGGVNFMFFTGTFFCCPPVFIYNPGMCREGSFLFFFFSVYL